MGRIANDNVTNPTTGFCSHLEYVTPVAALYVETNGAYFGLPGVEPWDEKRDARKYAGPWPAVAHPPCQRWGKLWAGQPLHIKKTGQRKKKGDDNGCFEAALAAVRKYGGVIEHPWGSHAWPHFGLKVPPRVGGWVKADDLGGWTCCVEQGRYGHYARKPTLIYVFGVELPELDWGIGEPRLDPAVVARMGLKRAKRLGEVGARGGGTDSSPRIGTPEPFREILISMARTARVNNVLNSEDCILQTTIQQTTNEPNTYPARNKENSVSINFTITAGSAGELVSELRGLTALLSSVGVPAAVSNEAVVEVVAEAVKPKATRAKKVETIIEHDPKEVKTDVHGAAATGAGSVGASGDAVENEDTDANNSESDAPEVEATAEVDAVADEPALTIDELRLFTIGQYLNVVFDGAEARKNAFGALLAEFDVKALKDLPSTKINAFKALVDAKIAKAVKA